MEYHFDNQLVMKDIIKALNKYIQTEYNVEGQFIERTTNRTDQKFKQVKHFLVELNYVINGKTITIIQDTISKTCTEETKERVEKEVKQEFLVMIFDFVASNEFKDLIYGRIDI